MEFFLVKDLVHKYNLASQHAEWRRSGQELEPYLNTDLRFPVLIKPWGLSKPSRHFAGNLREVLIKNNKMAKADFILKFEDGYPGEKILRSKIRSKINRRSGDGDDGFDSIFGVNNFNFEMTLSLCHLPTMDTPVSPDALFTFNRSMPWTDDYHDMEYKWYGFRSEEMSEIEELEKLWSHETGYIYSKLTILVTVNEKGVNRVMEENKGEDLNETQKRTRKMLEEEICTDLEIRCGDGKIVKGHRAVLGGSSKVFKAMFENQEMKEARTGILGMEEMSEEGVRGLLGWIYWGDEEKALEESDVAVEMLIAGDKWDLEGLVGKMEKIVLERRGYDEEWFSVESAVNLFGWARNLEGMRRLLLKAIAVLEFFGKTFPEKLVESEEYQDLIENDALAAALLARTQAKLINKILNVV